MPASGVAAEEVTPVSAETPVVAEPEATADAGSQANSEYAKPEKSFEQKELERLRRQLAKRDRTQFQMHQEREALARELEQYRSQSQGQQEERQPQVRPEDIDRLATQRAQEIATAREMQSRVSSVLEQGKSISGFDQLCNTVNEEVSFYEGGKPTPFLEAVLDSDKPHELLAYLGQNPDLAADLSGLSPARLGRRIEAIEREMKAAKVSKAPAPIKPVTPKGAPIAKAESEMTDAEWYAARRKR